MVNKVTFLNLTIRHHFVNLTYLLHFLKKIFLKTKRTANIFFSLSATIVTHKDYS